MAICSFIFKRLWSSRKPHLIFLFLPKLWLHNILYFSQIVAASTLLGWDAREFWAQKWRRGALRIDAWGSSRSFPTLMTASKEQRSHRSHQRSAQGWRQDAESSVPERWVRNLILGKRLRWEQQWGSLGKGSVLRSSQCLQVFTAEKHCLPSAARIRSQPHSLKNFAFKSKKAQRNGKLSKAQINVYFTEQTSSKWGFGGDFCWVVFFVWSSGEELSLAQMWKGTTNCRAAGLHSRHTWE